KPTTGLTKHSSCNSCITMVQHSRTKPSIPFFIYFTSQCLSLACAIFRIFVSQRTNISQYTKADATRSSAQIIMTNTGCK
ncbi:hypothetical protein Tsp_12189, partial [Trichinella spiralis]|uniref:hypothetical protein n=1 Tax=Trichinella spiralis TaxID=6334 RepID=UPI0001EFB678